MTKTWLKKLQTAQGMVEFALVLPVLLLVILGIFAFGHLFFTYSTVVSASREAARWGAAVGDAPSSSPRYQDCGAIRAAAVRIGKFAAVNATDIDPAVPDDTGVAITFDKGPHTGSYDDCPEGGTGPDEVVMGDRINVVVRVMYTPIVPLVNLPSFPLEATTSRTILRSVPVGEAPTASDPCFTPVHIQVDQSLNPSNVGEDVTYSIQVIQDKGSLVPTGNITLTDDSTDTPSHACDGTLSDGEFTCPSFTYGKPGTYKLTVVYESNSTCFPDFSIAEEEKPIHTVNGFATSTHVTVSPFNPGVQLPFTVSVTVDSVPPGSFPTGNATISVPGFPDCVVTLVNGAGTCAIPYTVFSAGPLAITGTYPDGEDPSFTGSSETITVDVLPPGITPTVGPTRTPTGPVVKTATLIPTPKGTPTKTPLPSWCPSWSGKMDFSGQQDALAFGLTNNDTKLATVSSISLTWPDSPTAKLQEVHFGNPSTGTCKSSAGTCLYDAKGNGINPPKASVGAGQSGWSGTVAQMASKASKELRLTFSHTLPNGHYVMKISFSNGCILEIEDDRLIVTP